MNHNSSSVRPSIPGNFYPILGNLGRADGWIGGSSLMAVFSLNSWDAEIRDRTARTSVQPPRSVN